MSSFTRHGGLDYQFREVLAGRQTRVIHSGTAGVRLEIVMVNGALT